jgi:PAS domain S-box-containing protein
MKSSESYGATASAEGRYRLLVESISDYAIYMLDTAGTVINWNAGAQRFKGYTPEEIIGQNFSRFYTDEDRAAGMPQRNLKRAATEGRFEEEGWRVRKDGTRFWASVVIDRVLDVSGSLVGFAKITRDLTERKARDEALQRSDQQFRMLVKGVTDYALYMLDPEGRVASWNSGAERIKRYAEGEIVGQHFSIFYGDEERAAGEPERNLQLARDQGSVEREGWRVRKDGTRFWAHVVIDALRDEKGTLIGFAKVTRDITERREAQKELEQAREALFQSQKMEAIGQLTGGVAHDFNNLLMAVLGSLEIASRRMTPDPRVTPFVENAIQAAQRGAALTKRMLSFSRREALEIGRVDVVQTVQGMGDILDRALGPAVFVSMRLPDNLPEVRTDRAQLESALLNLAVNARDAMPSGGPIVIAAAHKQVLKEVPGKPKPGNYVVLSVIDTGEGMDETTLARATEPFFTTKGVGKGTGLGLAMVHGLATQSGGAFVLTSQKGRGTTAELWLPVANGERVTAAEAVGQPQQEIWIGKRILVVDDDPLVLMNTVAMTEELGHRAVDATSGVEALTVLENEPVDLIITDYAMPRMTGGELAASIRKRWPNIGIVVATGYAEMPEAHKGKFGLLSKPFSSDDLRAAIELAADQILAVAEDQDLGAT